MIFFCYVAALILKSIESILINSSDDQNIQSSCGLGIAFEQYIPLGTTCVEEK